MSLTSLTTEMPVLRSLWRAICYFELLSSCIHVILSVTLVQACRSPLVAKGDKCQPPWLTSKTSKVHIHSIKYRFSKLLKLCYIVWLPVSCGLTSNKWTTLKQLPRYITVHFISQETVFILHRLNTLISWEVATMDGFACLIWHRLLLWMPFLTQPPGYIIKQKYFKS